MFIPDIHMSSFLLSSFPLSSFFLFIIPFVHHTLCSSSTGTIKFTRCPFRITANKGLLVGTGQSWASGLDFASEWHQVASSADSPLSDTGWEDGSCWRTSEKLWCRAVEHSERSWQLAPQSDADEDRRYQGLYSSTFISAKFSTVVQRLTWTMKCWW